MKEEYLKEIMSSIESKVGNEYAGIIADDFGKLITENQKTLDSLNQLNTEVSTLKDKNEKLISANGSLLQMIPQAKEEPKQIEKPEEKKPFNFADCFDSFGNFK